jgi:hypothetical protein
MADQIICSAVPLEETIDPLRIGFAVRVEYFLPHTPVRLNLRGCQHWDTAARPE